MKYEVEQKFPVTGLAAIESAVIALGGKFGSPETQTDRYFNHPARNFAETDEALRIRTIQGAGSANTRLTYKGPKIDLTTKTREEIEIPFGDDNDRGTQLGAMLLALGFRPAGVVEKTRRTAELSREDFAVEVTLDHVQALGQFVEIEIAADAASLDRAKTVLAALAAELGLTTSERQSYLELLLNNSANSAD